jgi:hypothetical protein
MQRSVVFVDSVKGLGECWISSKLAGLNGAIDAREVLVNHTA